MSNIINLKQARKKKAREEKEVQAADNRLKFGRAKAEKRKTSAEEAKQKKELVGHKLDKE